MQEMKWFKDVFDRQIRLTYERHRHIESDHPEMCGQVNRMPETLAEPDSVVRSKTDPSIELFYKHYELTPVTEKYLCVIVKILDKELFIVTAYFTDKIKKGERLWERK